MWDYIKLASELVRKACIADDQPGPQVGDLIRDAAVMLRKQGDELKKLKLDNFVVCPRCKQRVSKILESGQCGFCETMGCGPVCSE